jgi:glycogen(starch) synthase
MQRNTEPIIIETAWEVCNQVGGIYTVIRSKVPAMVEKWGNRYFGIGPYMPSSVASEFDPSEDYNNPVGQAVLKMREYGFEVHYGVWLVTGRPKVILFDYRSVANKLGEIKYFLWEDFKITAPEGSTLIDQVLQFSFQVTTFLRILNSITGSNTPVIAHFHEWMASLPLAYCKKERMNISTVFTTHATQLGRYLAMGDSNFYNNMSSYNWQEEAQRFGLDCPVKIERMSAHAADVFTTVSEVTGEECYHFLGKSPDIITPNGLNIERFTALHEFQNMHQEFKKKIHQFVMGHFFHSYKFDLDKTIYFFTSGRFEYKNKGFDLTLEALARLNWMMRLENIDVNVVMFFVTKQPYHSINPAVLQSRALMEEIRTTCEAIQKQVGERMFYEVATGTKPKLPPLNDFVDDYWKLRLRRTLQSWKTNSLPTVVTHNLVNDRRDEILNKIRECQLINNQHDKVKIVYHPDFISASSPLFGLDYGQFVRGCHLGVFPSYYEPWGYTPLECVASGVPTVTSDLAGFGDYSMTNVEDHTGHGIYVVRRRYNSYDDSANQLAEMMFNFVKQSRRDRITQRNKVESISMQYDWANKMRSYYDKAYTLALQRREGR